jgi:hypothetical protein
MIPTTKKGIQQKVVKPLYEPWRWGRMGGH